MATSRFNLVSLLVSVDVAATVLGGRESSGTAMSRHLWSGWFLPEGLRVKEALPSLNLLPLLPELFLLTFGLLPVLVGDLRKDLSVLLSALFLLVRDLPIVFLYLLAHLVFPLFDEGCFEPFFEFKEADILFLLFLKPLFFSFLQVYQLFVLDVHFLTAVPFKHLMRPLLHSYGLLFLFLDKSFQEVTFGLKDQLALQFGLMILTANPFSV